MKKYKTKDLVIQTILLLLPLLLYALYKNGYLIYEKRLISIYFLFKPLYLFLISVIIKLLYDLIFYRKLKIDYDLLIVIIVSMIVPYNINIIFYTISLIILYPLTFFLNKYIKFNKISFMYLIIIAICLLRNNLEFKTLLEIKYSYDFSFLNLLIGRNVGGISSTSILFSLIAYSILVLNYYYKKDIPLFINIVYLILMFTYFIITGNSSYLINSELIFASIFIATIPSSSPYRRLNQIIYSVIIGIISFVITIYYNSIIAIYIPIFFLSLFLNIRQKKPKVPISNN